MRQDYIETDYINGIYDADGNELLRPLYASEKEFLNKYYEEVVGANFLYDNELKDLNSQLREFKKKV